MRYVYGVLLVLLVAAMVLMLVPAASRVTLSATVMSPKSMDEVFAYMSDFTTTTEWDPATVITEKLSGDGTLGTQYRNTTEFNGNQTQLIYTVTDYRLNDRIELRGENKTLHAVDTITFRRKSEGTQVTYTAQFTFKGIFRLVSPFLRPAFGKLETGAEVGLRKAIG